MKKLLFIATLAVIMLLPEFSFCAPPDAEPLSVKLCELRQMLCGGGVGIAIAIVVVVTIGLMTIMGKINWPFIIIMIFCLILYFGANVIASLFVGDDVDCECSE